MTVPTPPRSKLVDLYFMEHRAKLIDLGAFLDRLDRANGSVESMDPRSETVAAREKDFRVDALRRAIPILTDGRPERARRILEILSDHSSEPIAAAGMKGATGAVDLR